MAILLIGEETPVSEPFGRIGNYRALEEEVSVANTMMMLLFIPLKSVSGGGNLSRTQVCIHGVCEGSGEDI